MKFRLSLLFYFFCIISYGQDISAINWLEDIKYLKKELPKKHIDLFNKQTRSYYNSYLDNIAANVQNFDDLEIAIKLQQLISSLGDSHTNISWTKFLDNRKYLPIRLHWFNDGIYIIESTNKYKDILGFKLLGINSFPIQKVIDSLSTMITVDNISISKRNIPQMMSVLQVLQYFKFTNNDSVYLNLKNAETGETLKPYLLVLPIEKLDKNDYIRLQPSANPISRLSMDKLFHSQYIPEEKIYYIQYNKCWSKELEIKYNNGKNSEELPSFNEFENKVLTDLDNEAIKKLVFDFRYNSGGNSQQGSLFIEKVMKNPKALKGIPVFVIISRYTFSSAIINVMDLKKYNNVILVGEETSGKPNHYGEVRQLKLPNTGLVVNYSTKFFRRTVENDSTIKPDVEILLTISDYINGIDPPFDYIKSH